MTPPHDLVERRFFTALENIPAAELRGGGEGEAIKIVGYAAPFNSPSHEMPIRSDQPGGRKFREVILPGAFAESLSSQRGIFAYLQHDTSAVLGSTANGTLRLAEDQYGLRYEIDPPNTQAGRDTVELIRRGDLRMSSFGFKVRTGGQMLRRDGDQIFRELRSLELLDVSPVTAGAYPATHVSLRSLDAALLELLEIEDGCRARMEMKIALASRR